MGQSYTIIRPRASGCLRCDVSVPPLYIQSTNASCQLGAFNHFDWCSFPRLVQTTEAVKVVVVAVATDGAASCNRMKFGLGEQVCEHNRRRGDRGVVLLALISCVGHKLHRDVERQVNSHTIGDEQKLIPALHATAWVNNLTDSVSAVARVLDRVVAQDLEIGFFPNIEPPAEAVNISRAFATLLLPRAVGRLPKQDEFQALLVEWVELLNGSMAGHTSHQRSCYVDVS